MVRRQKHKHKHKCRNTSAHLSGTRHVAADRDWELLNLEDGDKGDGGRFGGGEGNSWRGG